jgi:hypothetical protein
MKSLKELQESFQQGILAGDDAILAEVKDSAKEQRKVLFGVYRNAYVARLAEILADDYEQVHAYLGDQGFARLVKAYIAANPSDQRNARWFGRHLPAFVKRSEAFAKHPEVAELAALEKALADAFDGPDAEPLSIEQLAAIEPEAWPRSSCFSPTPRPSASPSRPMPPTSGRRSRTRRRRPSRGTCPSRKPQSSGARISWRASGRFRPRKR